MQLDRVSAPYDGWGYGSTSRWVTVVPSMRALFLPILRLCVGNY